jgi:large subunit ribosomal protein L14
MIYKSTQLKVIDNSGLLIVRCVRIINPKNRAVGTIGNLVLIRVYKKRLTSLLVNKKTLYFGLVISIKQYIARKDGSIIKLDSNSAIIFSRNYKFIGSKVTGIVMKEILFSNSQINNKKQKHFKILSLCNYYV